MTNEEIMRRAETAERERDLQKTLNEMRQKLWEDTCVRHGNATRERDEARAKLAEYERWQGEARKAARSLFQEYYAPAEPYDVPNLETLAKTALTAAHARGYAAGVAQEREECATAVDALDNRYASTEESYGYRKAAAAIRNRSGQ